MNKDSMIVRAAHESDAQAMGEVMVTTFLAAHRDQMPAEAWAKRSREWTPDVSARGWTQAIQNIAAGEIPYECIYVAEAVGGALVGLVMGGLVDEAARPPTGMVYALYVQEAHQGCGIGRKLLHAAAGDLALHNARTLRIGCLAANTPARRFYETMGGEMVDERLVDEEGMMLPEVVYEWADITLLAGDCRRETSESPQRAPADLGNRVKNQENIMSDYDQKVERIHAKNQPILKDFQSWLKKSGLSKKTVGNHCENIEFFSEYLTYYEPHYRLDEADAGDVMGFLMDWYPRKAMWSSEAYTRAYMASFRKFFKFMAETNRIEQTTVDEVRETLKENKEDFLDAVAIDDTDYDW